ncbi:hypothetical protein ACPW7J_09685 [Ihubacter sp. rT4E-8]|uniref:hypothetical protein n=1 Tax=Ihubacter sp. rT4E-8 TaxID=3242369 RepID=UPI003CEC8785
MHRYFNFNMITLLIIILLTFPLTACNEQNVECYECGKSIELDYVDDDEGNIQTYICENCAYSQGFIAGYNALVDELKPSTTGIDDGECISLNAISYILYGMYDDSTADKIIDQMIEADGGSVRVFDFDYIDEVPEKYTK